MDISQHMCDIARILRCNFTLRSQPLTHEQVFSPTGLLPGFMKRAEQLANFCFGHDLGLNFENAKQSMLGVKIEFNEEVPNSLRVLCVLDILIEFMQNAANYDETPLDDLMYD